MPVDVMTVARDAGEMRVPGYVDACFAEPFLLKDDIFVRALQVLIISGG